MDNDCLYEISEDEISNSFQDLKAKNGYLTDFCRENSIPLWTGSLVSASLGHALVRFEKHQPFDIAGAPEPTPQEEWDLLLNRIKKFNPSFILLEIVKPSFKIQDTKPWCLYGQLSAEIPSDRFNELLTKFGELWMRFNNKQISFKIYIFYNETKICIEYLYKSILYLALGEYERTSEDYEIEAQQELEKEEQDELEQTKKLEAECKAESEVDEEEEREYQEYLIECRERDEAHDKLAKELSKEKKLALTKNADQRYTVTKEFFGDRFPEIAVYAEEIARKAISLFEIDVLPALVKELKDAGKTAKNVSDELGISIAKAKKIYAVV